MPRLKQRVPRLLRTVVPGSSPISLVSWYKSFEDYLPTCEMQTKRWMVNNIGSDWICLDAGANIGYHSILMARQSSHGSVHSFEPTRTFSMLEKNVLHSGARNVFLNKVALGATGGRKRERLYRIWGQPSERYSGGWTTIDDYCTEKKLNRLDFIKIDVDGFDFEVLLGARRTLERFRPATIVEITHALQAKQQTAYDVFSFFQEIGYTHCKILDRENYLFQTASKEPREYASEGFLLEIDSWNPQELDTWAEADLELIHQLKNSQVLMNDGKVEESGWISSSGPAWSYVLKIGEVDQIGPREVLAIDVEVNRGALGVFISDKRCKKQISSERTTTDRTQTFYFRDVKVRNGNLIFRKSTSERIEFRVLRLRKLRLKQDL